MDFILSAEIAFLKISQLGNISAGDFRRLLEDGLHAEFMRFLRKIIVAVFNDVEQVFGIGIEFLRLR